MSLIIRRATKTDFIPIFKLIQEFAAFEKLSSEVIIAPKDFETDGTSGCFKCLVAEKANDVVGYALFFQHYSSFSGPKTYFEDLYIQPQLRGQGFGRAMYNAVCKEAFVGDTDRMRYAVLDWNVNAQRLYKSAGAIDWTTQYKLHIYRLERSNLEQLSQYSGTNVTIRKAHRDDASTIHKLTSEFAGYIGVIDHKRLLDEFTEDAFGNESNMTCFVAEVDNTAVGYSLHYPTYSTFQGKAAHLEELFVTSSCRRKGIGKALMASVAKDLTKASCSRMQFVVFSSDAQAMQFYKSLGAQNLTEEQGWWYYCHHKDNWKE